MLDDKQLVEACLKQDRSAQRLLYERFAGRLYGLSMRYMKSKDEAQDILQEAFIKIYKNLEKFRFDCPLEAWLKRIVINTALKAIEKNNKMLKVELAEGYFTNEDSPRNLGLQNLTMEELNNLIQSLPTGCQTVFNMFAIEGYKHSEIAEILEISEGTSKSQYSRARQLLMEKLENINGERQLSI